MANYIDVEKTIKEISEYESRCIPESDGKIWISTDTFKTFLKNRTAKDTTPNIHSKWKYIWKYRSNRSVTKCENCGWTVEEHISYKYCPNCGAIMDLK